MSRSEHFAQGAGHVDLFHGTNHEAAKLIQEDGFHASYSDSAHFVDRSQLHVAHSYAGQGGAVVHIRAPKDEVEDHGSGYYGVQPDEEDEDMPGHLDGSYVHCVNGPCTR